MSVVLNAKNTGSLSGASNYLGLVSKFQDLPQLLTSLVFRIGQGLGVRVQVP